MPERTNSRIFHYLNLKINTLEPNRCSTTVSGCIVVANEQKRNLSAGSQFIMGVQTKAVGTIAPVYTRRKRISGGTPDLPVSRFFSPIVIFSPPSANNIPRQNSIKTLRLWCTATVADVKSFYFHFFFRTILTYDSAEHCINVSCAGNLE